MDQTWTRRGPGFSMERLWSALSRPACPPRDSGTGTQLWTSPIPRHSHVHPPPPRLSNCNTTVDFHVPRHRLAVGCPPQNLELLTFLPPSSLRGSFSLPLSQIACSGWGYLYLFFFFRYLSGLFSAIHVKCLETTCCDLTLKINLI